MILETLQQQAVHFDSQDELAPFKKQFHFPKFNDTDAIYFCGNSLGLQPTHTKDAVLQELEDWKNLAINGFSKAKNPWLYYQEYLKPSMAKIVGCLEHEVTVMNTLTVNLHLLLLTFYKPTPTRFKILMEAGAFPSDQYAIETLVKHYGLNPNDCIVEIAPLPNAKTLSTAQIVEAIQQHKDSLAMVMFSGIQYYTGQLFDMATITQAAHKVGAICGFDLAHAVGNVPMQLHNWEVDFACWCSYKYLNGGPGAVGGLYVHEKYSTNTHLNRLAGWWGNDEAIRFKMEKGFVPKANASGWNISTAQVLNMVGLKASLEIFDATTMEKLRSKSIALTNYLQHGLQQIPNLQFEIITPANSLERGAQLSLYFTQNGKAIFEALSSKGIVVDYREPGVIRVAPTPLYCSFYDVFRFLEIVCGL
ncbi:MAG: kynureninase [Chitinophagaceae bacterium]